MERVRPRTPGGEQAPDPLIQESRYRRMFLIAVVSVSLVALLPLGIMSVITYRQYREAFRAELTRPMVRFAEAAESSLESYLSERISALALVMRQDSYETLTDPEHLAATLERLKRTYGDIVDLSVIRDDGVQIAYVGPYGLEGRDYSDQPWFREVAARGSYVSDVFMGYRNLPHIVVAIQRDRGNDEWFVLRASLDTDVFHWLVRDRSTRRPEQSSACGGCHALGVPSTGDAFIVNRAGLLQTPSRMYGGILEEAPLPSLPTAQEPRLQEIVDERGRPLVAAYTSIERSPFTLILLSPRDALHAGWQVLRRDLLLLPLVSGVVILAVIVGGAAYVVGRVKDADLKRASLYHKMEYTNKLAAIGRLGAGVAHEINNPLSIITQKAGLLHDRLTMSDEMPSRETILELVESVLKSAERCGGITHRLLGFAKHMDIQQEPIRLDVLLREVLGFLEKEAQYRSIEIEFSTEGDPPAIISDRGQLQQVFLNILNNAFAAVSDGGRIDIGIRPVDDDRVAVSVRDDGVGIPEADLEHIFDPFFTTKKGSGTGLGLSITYGIVQKLGGEIDVESRPGEGTCFTVTLPVENGGG